eukprot:TRINITY_DN19624_c0_g1_i1.p1 TRINITY_DN19624_c0_g1~~TRINITY_DN19624_c0_g1_i1.p1  ORF type:complete len:158 (+),score=32.16 TRINITY_DN19624_c0_g1_i1:64-537(+)
MSSKAVFEAAGKRFAPIPPTHEFLKMEAKKMTAEKAVLHQGVKAKAAAAAASSLGMWMLCGSIGVLCAATLYVCHGQLTKEMENERELRRKEKRLFRRMGDYSQEDVDLLDAAEQDAKQICRESGSVLGVYPHSKGGTWAMSLSDAQGSRVPLDLDG